MLRTAHLISDMMSGLVVADRLMTSHYQLSALCPLRFKRFQWWTFPFSTLRFSQIAHCQKKQKSNYSQLKKNSPLSPRIIIIFDNSALFPTSTSVGSRTGAVLCIHHLVILESNILSLRYIVFMPMNNGCILIAFIFQKALQFAYFNP